MNFCNAQKCESVGDTQPDQLKWGWNERLISLSFPPVTERRSGTASCSSQLREAA
jgi:hypothetical protein